MMLLPVLTSSNTSIKTISIATDILTFPAIFETFRDVCWDQIWVNCNSLPLLGANWAPTSFPTSLFL
jgi:hypothetical protein